MHPFSNHESPRQADACLNMTRRQLMGRTALGLGTASMAQLLGPNLLAEESQSNEGLHHAAKAKHVIYLFMSGGPSQLDLWDYKPKLKEMAGEQLPEHIRDGQRITGMTALIEPVMILFMAAIVGFIVISILLPIFEMNQMVG